MNSTVGARLAALVAAPPVPWRYLTLAGGACVVLLVLGVVESWQPGALNAERGSTVDPRWGLLVATISILGWAAAPALALWRPLVALVVAAGPYTATVLDAAHTWPLAMYVALVASGATATWRSRRAAVLIGLVAMLPPLGYALGRDTIIVGFGSEVTSTGSDVVLELAAYAVVAALGIGSGFWMRGSWAAARRDAALADRAEEVERESAVLGERARLARDLHDVVAHHVSLIAVRAETARYTVPDLSPGARELLAEIASDSRRALDELRGVLGVLGRATQAAELAPQPGAAEIDDLVEAARRSGEHVTYSGADLDAVAPQAGYVAYRVVQEALTNARRHARGAAVEVDVSAIGSGVLVRVLNPVSGGLRTGRLSEGNGLAGMRERVEAIGGSLSLALTDGVLRLEAAVPGEVR